MVLCIHGMGLLDQGQYQLQAQQYQVPLLWIWDVLDVVG